MKKQFFFSMLAAAAMMASCTSDKIVENVVEEGSEGYVAFSIQMPQVASGLTRTNDEFNDGRTEEYDVKNGYLFLFSGTDEASATYQGVFALQLSAPTTGAGTQCTSEVQALAHVMNAPANNMYAYVILNNNDLVNVSANQLAGNTLTVGTTTFATFSKIELAKLGDDANGFIMTNAPLAATLGGTTTPTGLSTLSILDKTKIFKTETEALAKPAGNIFVERAAAKVTVSLSSSLTATPELTEAPGVTYTKSSIKWALTNENTRYYNTRQMETTWYPYVAYASGTKSDGVPNSATKFRFASPAPIHTSEFRTYWGKDINYNAAPAVGDFKTNPTAATLDPSTDIATNGYVYTYENTFDVDHQSTSNTTGVLLSASFNSGVDFYTASTLGNNDILQAPSGGSTEVKHHIMSWLCNNNTAFKTWYDANSTHRISVTMTNNSPSAGKAVVATVTADDDASGFASTGVTETTINDAMDFKYYANGVAYYNIPIKHFGDAETPWNSTNHTYNTITDIYKKVGTQVLTDEEAAYNYLGRYGIVRNNWYQIEVGGIRRIGTPQPGGDWTPDTPDDNVENYISVKIHITPWALRKQSIIL